MKKTIDVLVGTRPEAIKMAPVVRELQNYDWAEVRVVVTGQHSTLLDGALESLGVREHENLRVMTDNQSLEVLTSKIITRLDDFWKDNKPDMVLGQGDTTTVFAGALVSFYQRIPFGHVEAGLRSNNIYSPFPEEMNRLLTTRLAAVHFAPTSRAVQALLSEGVAEDTIYLTGNTVIDTLKATIDGLKKEGTGATARRQILLTTHRRENFGGAMADLLRTIRGVVETRDDIELIFPVHPNPAVRKAAAQALGNHPRVNIIEPLDYPQFVRAMQDCYLIVTDSGGVQEEAPFIRRPVIVIRNETERPEALEYGVARLVRTDPVLLRSTLIELLDNASAYWTMTRGASPYGDGRAAQRIAAVVGNRLRVESEVDIPAMFDPDLSIEDPTFVMSS